MSEYLKNRIDRIINNPDVPMFPEVEVQLTGNDGNALSIMGNVSTNLREFLSEEDLTKDEINNIITQYREESMAGDYDNLLRTAMKWVEVF